MAATCFDGMCKGYLTVSSICGTTTEAAARNYDPMRAAGANSSFEASDFIGRNGRCFVFAFHRRRELNYGEPLEVRRLWNPFHHFEHG